MTEEEKLIQKVIAIAPRVFEVAMATGQVIFLKGEDKDFVDQINSGRAIIPAEAININTGGLNRIGLTARLVAIVFESHSMLDVIRPAKVATLDNDPFKGNPNFKVN